MKAENESRKARERASGGKVSRHKANNKIKGKKDVSFQQQQQQQQQPIK